MRLFASARSAGSELDGRVVEEATPEALAAGDLDLCLFSVGSRASRELVPHAVRGGAVCVDKSEAFRLQDGVPLVVPEVNGERALEHDGIVANPNCCTIPLTLVLKPLHDAVGLRAVRVATYQSASGKGAQRLQQLLDEPQAEHDLSSDWDFDGEEFDEEVKLREETRKILELPELAGQRDLRARAGAGRPRRVGVARDRGAARALARARAARRRAVGAGRGLPDAARPRPAATRRSSAGSAATRPPRTASRSSSPATTCARARP